MASDFENETSPKTVSCRRKVLDRFQYLVFRERPSKQPAVKHYSRSSSNA